MFRITRDTIAEFGGLAPEPAAACQQALLNRKETWDSLSCNPDLTTETWKRLWGNTRPSAARAKRLVARPLTKDLRAIVIEKENRVSVLACLIEENELDLDEQRRLLDKGNVGEHLLKQQWFSESLRKEAALSAGGAALLHELAYAPQERFSDEEVKNLLDDHHRWSGVLDRPSSTNARALRVLFGRRGVAGTGLQASGSPRTELLTALAGSANLTEAEARWIVKFRDGKSTLTAAELEGLRYCLMALVANPRCTLEVIDALSAILPAHHDVAQAAKRRSGREAIHGPISGLKDPDQIEWLLSRSCPAYGSFGFRQGRPLELIELAKNQNLNDEQRAKVVAGLGEDLEPELRRLHPELGLGEQANTRDALKEDRTAMVLPDWYTSAMDLASRKLGADQQRWETLLGLLEDFEGNFEELVELAEHL